MSDSKLTGQQRRELEETLASVEQALNRALLGGEAPPKQWRYTGTCPAGHVLTRDRLRRSRDGGVRRQSCAACAPGFDERFLVTWKRTDEEG